MFQYNPLKQSVTSVSIGKGPFVVFSVPRTEFVNEQTIRSAETLWNPKTKSLTVHKPFIADWYHSSPQASVRSVLMLTSDKFKVALRRLEFWTPNTISEQSLTESDDVFHNRRIFDASNTKTLHLPSTATCRKGKHKWQTGKSVCVYVCTRYHQQ